MQNADISIGMTTMKMLIKNIKATNSQIISKLKSVIDWESFSLEFETM